jgi:hypothetical protein
MIGAQTSGLMYRAFPIRKCDRSREPADWKSAIQQVGNLLRYKRSALRFSIGNHRTFAFMHPPSYHQSRI